MGVDNQKRQLDELRRRRLAYKTIFDSPEGELVIADLERFCKVHKSSFVIGDPYATAFNEGRREVCLRIKQFLHATEAELEAASKINQVAESE